MAVINTFQQDAVDLAEPLTLDAAHARSCQAALEDSEVGAVGLEIEAHLVDLHAVPDVVAWHRVDQVTDDVRAVADGSAVTFEPGGQLELSGRPEPDIAGAVAGLRRDWQGVRLALAEHGLGAAFAGADPLRPSRRINPRPRYQAMEEHFAATGRAAAGAVMMNSTAALQLNLQAGPKSGWPARVDLAHRLGPTLVAISACSPWLHGRATGWKSVRQATWAQLDPRACGPVPGCDAGSLLSTEDSDPAAAWAHFAMSAPVIFVRSQSEDAQPVCTPVTFGQWASGRIRLCGRQPTVADLDTHLTTLFPPVRMRGYLELRYLDVTAPRWWPAIAAVAATLLDDKAAADQAMEATERTARRWGEAARHGLRDDLLADSARRCLAIAAGRAPAELRTAVADLAELVESRRSPGDLLASRIDRVGPLAAFEELAHA
ncbi:MAG TPA: ergothioneine biosynthesis glutamate--cysteine ligase EgtA [Streptosporangiaceae bacterium]|nr:ergothioneine biosynthesis glutamate--cysteine ligase EgtA [Streptosporangiaceae bacterium]